MPNNEKTISEIWVKAVSRQV